MATSWLQGGPFLEISFLWESLEGREQIAHTLISRLSALPFSINIMDQNIDELITGFAAGYSYNEEDPQSAIIYSLEFKLEADISGKRRAVLYMEQLSPNTFLVIFRFFGSQFDAPEWKQIGVQNKDLVSFIGFLANLYESFGFLIGGIAIDEDIREMFDCHSFESYRFEELFAYDFLQRTNSFYALLWNGDYIKLQNLPVQHIRTEKSGILAVFSYSYSEF